MRLRNEGMSMERNIGDMLPMLLPNKDDRNAQFKVGQWVDNIKSSLTDEQVETKLWVCIACRKIPIEKCVKFKEWATENARRNEVMDALRDFLLESYVGAATRLDVWRLHRPIFSDMLPLDLMDKLVANLAPKDTVKFVDLVTRAQSFFNELPEELPPCHPQDPTLELHQDTELQKRAVYRMSAPELEGLCEILGKLLECGQIY
ncbi:hypothetical protein LPJ66_009207, partial [Kickxella alabastrina]